MKISFGGRTAWKTLKVSTDDRVSNVKALQAQRRKRNKLEAA